MMRPFFAILAGFVFTLGVFVSGLAVATWFLAAEPVQQAGISPDVTDLWTKEPRTVKTPVVGLERLPARTTRNAPLDATEAADASATAIDATTTSAITPAAASEHPPADAAEPANGAVAAAPDPSDEQSQRRPMQIAAAHVEWCASRYRSYDPATNSYRPYSGGSRPCVSPYWEAVAAVRAPDAESAMDALIETTADETETPSPLELGYASADEDDFRVVSDDHIAYCFSRYRSYRPEDNTYQPYGGGPRKQCE